MTGISALEDKKWEKNILLFDNGVFSVCFGIYDEECEKRLGLRWNSDFDGFGLASFIGKSRWNPLPFKDLIAVSFLDSLIAEIDAGKIDSTFDNEKYKQVNFTKEIMLKNLEEALAYFKS